MFILKYVRILSLPFVSISAAFGGLNSQKEMGNVPMFPFKNERFNFRSWNFSFVTRVLKVFEKDHFVEIMYSVEKNVLKTYLLRIGPFE